MDGVGGVAQGGFVAYQLMPCSIGDAMGPLTVVDDVTDADGAFAIEVLGFVLRDLGWAR